ncbi:MAG: hypothetical protein K0U12_05770 [Gammaproteobacteria bacterium]|nr:hypothetical protein [Gammaproteobacteria bacterium]
MKLVRIYCLGGLFLMAMLFVSVVEAAKTAHTPGEIQHKNILDKTPNTFKSPVKPSDIQLKKHHHNRHVLSKKSQDRSQTKKPNFKIDFAGYAQEDYLLWAGVPSLTPHLNWRSTNYYFDVEFLRNWQFIFEYELYDKNVQFAALSFDGIPHTEITVGQQFILFGLENNSSTTAITFMEFGLPDSAFATPYANGVSAMFNFKPVMLYGSFFAAPLTNSQVVGHQPLGETAELAWIPFNHNHRVLQFSASYWHQGTDAADSAEFSTIPELLMRNNASFIDTGGIDDVNAYNVIDLTSAWVRGPFTAQAEYLQAWVQRNLNLSTLSYKGFYVSASYFLTGESRDYSSHELGFAGISAIRHRYCGAWQLALRYSQLNLISGDTQGGRERDITVGLNWFFNKYFEMLFNYVHMHTDPSADGLNQTGNLYGIRLQLSLES